MCNDISNMNIIIIWSSIVQYWVAEPTILFVTYRYIPSKPYKNDTHMYPTVQYENNIFIWIQYVLDGHEVQMQIVDWLD
jgi:hypothetical protein